MNETRQIRGFSRQLKVMVPGYINDIMDTEQ